MKQKDNIVKKRRACYCLSEKFIGKGMAYLLSGVSPKFEGVQSETAI